MIALLVLIFAIFACVGVWATLPVATAITRSGLLVSGALPTTASTADEFANTGKEILLVRNGDASPHTVTLLTAGTLADGGAANLTIQDPTVVIAAGETRAIGPFKPSLYNNSNGRVGYTLDAATSMTVQVVKSTPFSASE